MMYFLVSLLLGIFPDILYFLIYISKIKKLNLKNNLLLFFLLTVIYFLFIFLKQRNFYLYILYDIALYFVLKFICKSQINDFFLIVFLELYYYLISCFCFFCIQNYTIAFILNKILMFLPLFFIKHIEKAYKTYNYLWNRNYKQKNLIKSLTLRNISLTLMNLSVLFFYITLLYILNIS